MNNQESQIIFTATDKIQETPLFTRMSVLEQRPYEGYEHWREGLGPLISADVVDIRRPFFSYATLYMVDEVVFGMSNFCPAKFGHSSATEKWDQPSQIYIQLAITGGYEVKHGGREFDVYPGDITIYDQSKKLYCERKGETNCSINLVLSRKSALKYFGSDKNLAAKRIIGKSIQGKTLGQQLHWLYVNMADMTVSESSHQLDLALKMLASAFNAPSTNESIIDIPSETENSHLIRITRWIQQNLNNPLLSAELICKNCFVSRATLFRILSPYGGVTSYIHELRLQKCLDEIVKLHRSSTITEISEKWGYSNYPHFSRLFKKRYTISPGEIQELYSSPADVNNFKCGASANSDLFQQWLSLLAAH